MTKPIIPWIGGKRRLANILLQRIPQHRCYVEVFAGGAAIYMLKEPSKTEVINDINGELINLYRVVQRHLDEFVRSLRWLLSSRQIFSWLKDSNIHSLTDIERAVRFYYLQKHAFGAKVSSQSFGTATTDRAPLNLLRIEESLSLAHLRLQGTYIEHLEWRTCIKKYDRPHTCFYLDPPYWQVEGYGIDFPWDEYVALKEILQSIQGKCILSINHHPDICALFADFRSESVQIDYTVGGSQEGQIKKAKELIIYNW